MNSIQKKIVKESGFNILDTISCKNLVSIEKDLRKRLKKQERAFLKANDFIKPMIEESIMKLKTSLDVTIKLNQEK